MPKNAANKVRLESSLRFDRLHIFKMLRYAVPRRIVPAWLLFGLVDWVYQPTLWILWGGLRLVAAVLMVALARVALYTPALRKRWFFHYVVGLCLIATTAINVMIGMSGGSASYYIYGLILTVYTAKSLFQLPLKFFLAFSLGAYAPTILMCALDGGYVVALLIAGMLILSNVISESELISKKFLMRTNNDLAKEVGKLRRKQILSSFFPKVIRDKIEAHVIRVDRPMVIPNCVVGFADMKASTSIANQINLLRDWEMKNALFKLATRLAKAHGMVVLTHLGDGFLFVANFDGDHGWVARLIGFIEALKSSVQEIFAEYVPKNIETGIKFGVCSGPVTLGFMGDEQAFYTGCGPTVNLASRLCDVSGSDDFVVSTRVWEVLQAVLPEYQFQKGKSVLKGFGEIGYMHLKRQQTELNQQCQNCGGNLEITSNASGFLTFACAQCEAKKVTEDLKLVGYNRQNESRYAA